MPDASGQLAACPAGAMLVAPPRDDEKSMQLNGHCPFLCKPRSEAGCVGTIRSLFGGSDAHCGDKKSRQRRWWTL